MAGNAHRLIWYKFDGDTTDSSSNGHDATNYGSGGYTDDSNTIYGRARNIATSADYTSTSLTINPTDFTIKARVKFNSATTNRYFFALTSNLGGVIIGLMTPGTGSHIFTQVYDDNAQAWRAVNASDPITVGRTYNIYVTFDSSYIRLYIDGVETGTPYALASWEKTYGGILNLGRYYSSAYWCQCEISDVWIEDYAWSAAQILTDSSSFCYTDIDATVTLDGADYTPIPMEVGPLISRNGSPLDNTTIKLGNVDLGQSAAILNNLYKDRAVVIYQAWLDASGALVDYEVCFTGKVNGRPGLDERWAEIEVAALFDPWSKRFPTRLISRKDYPFIPQKNKVYSWNGIPFRFQ